MYFVESLKWWKMYPDANGRGLYGEMRHNSRNAGKKYFLFYDLWFMSYRPKRKVCCYSATIRLIDIILSSLICQVIMNLTSKSCKFCPYGLREINSSM